MCGGSLKCHAQPFSMKDFDAIIQIFAGADGVAVTTVRALERYDTWTTV
jgi:hypothetical protein